MFLTAVASAATSYAVVKTASAAIFTHHEMAGVETPPTKHAMCKSVRAAAKCKLGLKVRNRKEPLTLEDAGAIAQLLVEGEPRLHELMIATYVMVCFVGFLRYDDAQRLLVRDVRLEEDRAELFLSKRKNDQFREGDVVVLAAGRSEVCPVALLRRFLAEARWAPEEPLFRDWDGHKARGKRVASVFHARPVAYGKMRGVVLSYVGKVLGLSREVAQQRFGLHSLRSGGVTAVAAQGVSERLFQAHGGWRSREAMLPYLQEGIEARKGVTGVLQY
jgi:integrase